MPPSLDQIAPYLACPDDKTSLDCRTEGLACCQCGRIYPVVGGEVVELLPRAPAVPTTNREYALEYDRQFHRAFETGDESMAWGTREASVPAWVRKRERQRRAALSVLRTAAQPLPNLVLCDVSAGPGDYTLFCARHFKWVLHCDLSVDSLQYALRRARQIGIANVFFLRVDYFALPFCHSLDRVLCLDTLIRGREHEKALLEQIRGALGPEGRALIDFHHWWHNPLRRLGLLPQNFGRNRSYTRRQSEALLRESGIEKWRLIRFYQEFEPDNAQYKRLSSVLPAARLMYEFESYGSAGDQSEKPVRSGRLAG
jgi:SAM-dependent methyltransferase